MSFFGRLSQFFARLLRDDPRSYESWPYRTIAGITLTYDQAVSLSAVWGCMDIISKSIAGCTWNIYEPVPATKRRRLLDQDPRAWLLNTRPNPDMTAIGFREALLLQALAQGNAYAEIVRDVSGRVVELWPLANDRVTPRRNEAGRLVYDVAQAGRAEVVTLDQSEVFHLRGPGINGLMGENIIARAAGTLAVAAAQERFSADFFGRGAQLAGVLTIPTKVGKEQHELLRKEWAENHSGGKNSHKPLILEGGMEFTPTASNPKDTSLVDDKKFSVEDICRWWGVPPHKVQHLEHATFSNIEHSDISFVRDSLRPWERRLSQEADYKLFPQTRGPWRVTEIDLSPLTRGDAQSRALAQASWRQNGIMSANEIRAQEGLDDIGADGDVFLVQQNMTKLSELGVKEDAAAVHRQAAVASLKAARARFAKRLEHRTASVTGKPDAAKRLDDFRREQVAVVFDELVDFSPHFKAVVGRELTLADAERLLSVEPESLLLPG